MPGLMIMRKSQDYSWNFQNSNTYPHKCGSIRYHKVFLFLLPREYTVIALCIKGYYLERRLDSNHTRAVIKRKSLMQVPEPKRNDFFLVQPASYSLQRLSCTWILCISCWNYTETNSKAQKGSHKIILIAWLIFRESSYNNNKYKGKIHPRTSHEDPQCK